MEKKVVSSSMIDLKAELFRKQEEFRNQKTSSSGFVKGKRPEKSGKPSLWSQKNKGISARASKDEESVEEEEDKDAFEKSRRALEEKAKLYKKITASDDIPEEDGSSYFLVDFQKKAIDTIVSEREAERRREEEEKEREDERLALAQPVPEAASQEEEWVDFVDSLGRSRRCMRKDLNQLMKQDRDLALRQLKSKKGLMDGSQTAPPLVSRVEEYRDKMREKWDKETEVLASQEHGQVHYSNVQYDEIRTHGVGFFQFSKDHESREEQMESLKKFREETKDEKSRKDRIKEKRKNMMEARLAKVRQRRKLKDSGAPEEDTVKEEEASSATSVSVEEGSSSSLEEKMKKKEEEKKEKEAEENRKSHIRDWDKGKPSVEMMYQNYVDKRRQERDEDFAPPSLYFQDNKSSKQKQRNTNVKQTDSMSDLERISRLQEMTKSSSPFPPSSHVADHTKLSSVGQKDGTSNTTESDRGSSGATIHSISKALPPDFDLSTVPLPTTVQQDKCRATSDNSTNSSTGQPAQMHSNQQTDCIFPQSQQYSNYQAQPAPGWQSHEGGGSHNWNVSSYDYSNQQANYQQTWPADQYQNDYQQMQPGVQQPGDYYTGHNMSKWPQHPSDIVSNASLPQHQQITPTNFISSDTASHNQPNPSDPPSYSSHTNTPHHHQYPAADTSQTMSQATNACISKPPQPATKRPAKTPSSKPPPEKKKSVPKQAIVDHRFMLNDTDPSLPEMATIEAPTSVTGVEYKFGSFTAAKTADQSEFEESVLQSQQMSQISGGPHLYTAEELKEKEEEEKQAKVEEKVQDFLDSLK